MYINTFQFGGGGHIGFLNFEAFAAIFELGIQKIWEQGTMCGPKCFMMYINDLSTPVPLYKYVDDSTLFQKCEMNSISLMQHSVKVAAEWTNNKDMKIT